MSKAPSLPQRERELLATLQKDHLWRRAKLLSEAGWSLQSIANGFDPPRRRSTIRSWVVKSFTAGTYPETPPVPSPPVKHVRPRRKKVPSPGISLDDQLRIARLSPLARRYRARAAENSSSSLANRELTLLTGILYSRGVTVSELARASGVTYRAMKRRVDRSEEKAVIS